MYKINDYVMYKKDVCIVKEINEKKFNNMDYYCLIPISDSSLKIDVPFGNKDIRDLISKQSVERIIEDIPNIPLIEANDRLMEHEYRALINTGRHEDLISIIKTTYLRNKHRIENNKKTGDIDNNYFELAEKYLYNEFSVVLGMSYEDTKDYVIQKVGKIEASHH